MALTQQEIESFREKLEVEKEKLQGKKLPSVVCEALEAIKKDLTRYDPHFSFYVLGQLEDLLITKENEINDVMKLEFARSILKAIKSDDQLQVLFVVQMIGVHDAAMDSAKLRKKSKTHQEFEIYGNALNKLTRTYTDQMGTLHRLRSGPEPSLQYNVSVNEGGQAIVGTVNQNDVDKGKAEGMKAPPVITDQSGTAMLIIQTDDESVATVPRMDQDDQPAASAAKRRRRA